MMGLSPSELEEITPYEFNLLLEGYNQRELREEHRARMIYYMIYCSIPKAEGQENQSMYDLFPLPGDPVRVPDGQRKIHRQISVEEKQRLEALMNAIP